MANHALRSLGVIDAPFRKILQIIGVFFLLFLNTLSGIHAQEISFSPMESFWSDLSTYPDTRNTEIMCARTDNGLLYSVEDSWMDSTAFIRTFDGVSWSSDIIVQFDTRYPRLNRNRNNERPILDVIKFRGDIYICGNFHSVDSISGTAGIARWNGFSWESVGGGVDTNLNHRNYTIRKMCVFNDQLYVIGDFGILGNNIARYIAVWDGNSWQNVGGTQPQQVPTALKHMDTDGNFLYVSGTFYAIGQPAVNVNNIARWNGTEWFAADSLTSVGFMKFDPDLNKIIVFTNSNEPIRTWNGNTWEVAYPPTLNNVAQFTYVSDMQHFGNRFYLSANDANQFQSRLLFYENGAWTIGTHQIKGQYLKGLFTINQKLYTYGQFFDVTHHAIRPINIAEVNDYVCKIRGLNYYDLNNNCIYDGDSVMNFYYDVWDNYAFSGGFSVSSGNYEVDAPQGNYFIYNHDLYAFRCKDTLTCGTSSVDEQISLNRNHTVHYLRDLILKKKPYYRSYKVWVDRNWMNQVGQDSIRFFIQNESTILDTLTYRAWVSAPGNLKIVGQRPHPDSLSHSQTFDYNKYLTRNQWDTVKVDYDLWSLPPADSFRWNCYYLVFDVTPPPTLNCYSGNNISNCTPPLLRMRVICRRQGRHPVIRCGRSYDPNIKTVSGSHICDPECEYCTASLNYKITFQNTGTAPAELVIVKDDLPGNLDPNTFSFGSSSHPCTVTQNGNSLTFTFPNINLPDSATSPSESIGWLTFSVKSILVHHTDKIDNGANIYFDSNAPVATNIATYTFPFCDQDTPFVYRKLRLFSQWNLNRNKVQLKWKYSDVIDPKSSYYVLSKSVDAIHYERLEIFNGGYISYTDEKPALGNNHYKITLYSNEGKPLAEAYTMVNRVYVPTLEPEVVLYPNPAEKEITLQLNANPNQNIIVQLYNAMGQITGEFILSDLYRLDVSAWANGIYFLRFTDNNGWVKTEKVIIKH